MEYHYGPDEDTKLKRTVDRDTFMKIYWFHIESQIS